MTTETREDGLVPLAAKALRENYTAFVVIALLQAALQSLPAIEANAGVVATAAVIATVLQAPLLHLALHSQTGALARGTGAWERFAPFLGRLALLSVPTLMVGLALPASIGTVLVMLFVSLATTALFGTMLPDIAAGGRGRLSDAFERGKRTAVRFLIDTAVGPLLQGIIAIFAAQLVLGLLSPIAGGPDFGENFERMPVWYFGLTILLFTLAGIWIALLSAAVLTRQWLIAMGSGPRLD